MIMYKHISIYRNVFFNYIFQYNLVMNQITIWLNNWTLNGKLSILIFFPLAMGVLVAAFKSIKYAEVMIYKSKMKGAFVGGVLLAGISSLPELITEVSQSASGNPGVGSADDIGANAFTTLLMGFATLLFVRRMFMNNISKWTRMSMVITALTSSLLTILLYLRSDLVIGVIGQYAIGIIPFVFFLIYLLSIWLSNKFATEEDEEKEDMHFVKKTSLKKGIILFCFWGLTLVIFSLGLNTSVSSIQQGYNISSESAGGILLSMTTALPEAIAFFVLLKDKQYTVAIAAIIGSHMFNMSMIFFGDFAFTESPIFTNYEVHKNWTLALMTTIMMIMLIIQVQLGYRIKVFKENKVVYSIIPVLTIFSYFIGWGLILFL